MITTHHYVVFRMSRSDDRELTSWLNRIGKNGRIISVTTEEKDILTENGWGTETAYVAVVETAYKGDDW